MMIRATLTFFVISLCVLRAAEVGARLSTDAVQVGQGALLSLTIEGGSPEAEPVIPAVENLVVNPRGQSQNVQFVNGRVSRSVTYSYVVGSMQAGEYEIPAITVRVGGEDFTTDPLKLVVGGAAAGAPAGIDRQEEPGEADESDQHGFLTFQMSEKERNHVYPGEIAPVRIRAYFPMEARVSLSGPPRPEGSAFTLHNLTEEPQQSTEVIDGRRHRVVTWYGGLSATKAGSYPASFTLGAVVAVRDRSARRRPSAFDDPFFGGSMLDDFFAPVVQKEVELTTEDPSEIEVTELPTAGRPENFSGAIGEFAFDSVRVPSELRTGEPCRIEATVKGSGNFALLKEPHPLPAEDWKTYEGSAEFKPGDVASFAGSKTFRYSAVPQSPGEKQVSLAFSYFDPERGEYRSVESEPQAVIISGEAVKTAQRAVAESVPEGPTLPQLAPLRTEAGAVRSFAPLSEQAWFVPVLAGSGVLSLGILGLAWWRERGVDVAKASRRAIDAATRDALATAEKAAVNGDAAAFFIAARDALRHGLAERSGMKPEAVTRADLHGLEDDEIAEILSVADQVDYSGKAAAVGDLGGWNVKLHRGLERLAIERRKHAA